VLGAATDTLSGQEVLAPDAWTNHLAGLPRVESVGLAGVSIGLRDLDTMMLGFSWPLPGGRYQGHRVLLLAGSFLYVRHFWEEGESKPAQHMPYVGKKSFVFRTGPPADRVQARAELRRCRPTVHVHYRDGR
jgi:hypothetical protein